MHPNGFSCKGNCVQCMSVEHSMRHGIMQRFIALYVYRAEEKLRVRSIKIKQKTHASWIVISFPDSNYFHFNHKDSNAIKY